MDQPIKQSDISVPVTSWRLTPQVALVAVGVAAFFAQVGVVFILCMSLNTASKSLDNAQVTWNSEIAKRRTDATLKYIDKLSERDFVDNLWDLQEFTICFENSTGDNISYLPIADVKANESRYAVLASKWFDIVENEVRTVKGCGKPKDIERKMMVVYGRLGALASCLATDVCDKNKLYDFSENRGMIEAFDYLTVLSISNYLLLSTVKLPNGETVSREWSSYPEFAELMKDFEKYIYNPNNPILTAVQRERIWNRRTRCFPPQDESESRGDWYQRNDWRSCGTIPKNELRIDAETPFVQSDTSQPAAVK